MSAGRSSKRLHTTNARAARKGGASESTRPGAEKKRGIGATGSSRRREKPKEIEPGRPIAGESTTREKQKELLAATRADGEESGTSKGKRRLASAGLLTKGSTGSRVPYRIHRLLVRLNDQGKCLSSTNISYEFCSTSLQLPRN